MKYGTTLSNFHNMVVAVEKNFPFQQCLLHFLASDRRARWEKKMNHVIEHELDSV
ncbi:MAG: hypothetical protein HC912_05795 [Saprospiraceae bacterium]|nr:hypothetical protein [Saprospiraceae bacterium]